MGKQGWSNAREKSLTLRIRQLLDQEVEGLVRSVHKCLLEQIKEQLTNLMLFKIVFDLLGLFKLLYFVHFMLFIFNNLKFL